jgi:hypothetical protein
LGGCFSLHENRILIYKSTNPAKLSQEWICSNFKTVFPEEIASF